MKKVLLEKPRYTCLCCQVDLRILSNSDTKNKQIDILPLWVLTETATRGVTVKKVVPVNFVKTTFWQNTSGRLLRYWGKSTNLTMRSQNCFQMSFYKLVLWFTTFSQILIYKLALRFTTYSQILNAKLFLSWSFIYS